MPRLKHADSAGDRARPAPLTERQACVRFVWGQFALAARRSGIAIILIYVLLILFMVVSHGLSIEILLIGCPVILQPLFRVSGSSVIVPARTLPISRAALHRTLWIEWAIVVPIACWLCFLVAWGLSVALSGRPVDLLAPVNAFVSIVGAAGCVCAIQILSNAGQAMSFANLYSWRQQLKALSLYIFTIPLAVLGLAILFLAAMPSREVELDRAFPSFHILSRTLTAVGILLWAGSWFLRHLFEPASRMAMFAGAAPIGKHDDCIPARVWEPSAKLGLMAGCVAGVLVFPAVYFVRPDVDKSASFLFSQIFPLLVLSMATMWSVMTARARRSLPIPLNTLALQQMAGPTLSYLVCFALASLAELAAGGTDALIGIALGPPLLGLGLVLGALAPRVGTRSSVFVLLSFPIMFTLVLAVFPLPTPEGFRSKMDLSTVLLLSMVVFAILAVVAFLLHRHCLRTSESLYKDHLRELQDLLPGR
ncbi:MAG: hypothetical protein FJY92_00065 [Candidatus Hydrogenedentes bacterium]|nr:hypothetical protein [Candidatus Hydrogenedentota bacterium]